MSLASNALMAQVTPGFEPVAEAFERNFVDHGQLGAAPAAVVDGQTVVDLYGGMADQQISRMWDEGTLQT